MWFQKATQSNSKRYREVNIRKTIPSSLFFFSALREKKIYSKRYFIGSRMRFQWWYRGFPNGMARCSCITPSKLFVSLTLACRSIDTGNLKLTHRPDKTTDLPRWSHAPATVAVAVSSRQREAWRRNSAFGAAFNTNGQLCGNLLLSFPFYPTVLPFLLLATRIPLRCTLWPTWSSNLPRRFNLILRPD